MQILRFFWYSILFHLKCLKVVAFCDLSGQRRLNKGSCCIPNYPLLFNPNWLMSYYHTYSCISLVLRLWDQGILFYWLISNKKEERHVFESTVRGCPQYFGSLKTQGFHMHQYISIYSLYPQMFEIGKGFEDDHHSPSISLSTRVLVKVRL